MKRLVLMVLAGAVSAASFASVMIAPGEGWTPLTSATRIEKGSALDFSNLVGTREPAGKYGWTVVKDSHFEFEKRPGVKQRFYGVNLCFECNFMSKAEAEELCTRLERLGYNSIRIHHHDGVLCEGSKDGTTIEPKRMAELDTLMAAAIRHGLYVTTDLYVSRSVPYRVVGIDKNGKIPTSEYKELALCNEAVFSNLVAYTKAFLGHVNPLTGRRWADEPAMPLLALINEGNPGNYGFDRSRKLFGITMEAMDDKAFMNYVCERQHRFDMRMIEILRKEIGYRGLVSNLSCWSNPGCYQELRKSYDYVDDHFYVDHPRFLKEQWELPSASRNANPITYDNKGIQWKKPVRLADRPFTITEWNFSGPGRYRGAGGIVFGAGAALQDMDGIWRFAWSHERDEMFEDSRMSYFNASTDPLMLATERAIIPLYLRGDMPVDRKIGGPMNCACMTADKTAGTFTLNTARTCGVFSEPSDTALTAGPLSVTIKGHSAAVWATSLDGKALAESRHILVTHVTDVQDSGTVYRAEDRTVLEKWGELPHLMANGTAAVTLATSGKSAKVYALAPVGTRLGEIKANKTLQPNALSFMADVARTPKAATYLYEIVL